MNVSINVNCDICSIHTKIHVDYVGEYGLIFPANTSCPNGHDLKGQIRKQHKKEFEKQREKIFKAWRNEMMLIIKKCPSCNHNLYYDNFEQINKGDLTKRQLLKLWKCPGINIFCCHCYQELREMIKKRQVIGND